MQAGQLGDQVKIVRNSTATAFAAASAFLVACGAAPPGALTSCQQLDVLPGSSTNDILFVVDDSASMDPKQQALAANFTAFIDAINGSNAAQVAKGLEPFDFHIAVTTSSIFFAAPTGKAR